MEHKPNIKGSKRRGRPKFELDTESLKAIEEVISSYRNNVKPRGIISINSIVKHSKELYEDKRIGYLFSEHFWKNGEGRNIIEEKNQVIKAIPMNNTLSDSNTIVDTEDAIEKLYKGNHSNKKKLINSLIRNEKNLIRLQKENKKFKDSLEKLQKELEIVKEDKNRALASLKEVESIMFNWLNASAHKDVPLTNIITTGNSRNSIVNKFFETAFDKPMDGYKKFEEYRLYRGDMEEGKSNRYDSEKVIELKDKNKNSLYNIEF